MTPSELMELMLEQLEARDRAIETLTRTEAIFVCAVAAAFVMETRLNAASSTPKTFSTAIRRGVDSLVRRRGEGDNVQGDLDVILSCLDDMMESYRERLTALIEQ